MSALPPDPKEIARLSQKFESASPQEIIAWAVETFWPDVAISSSFQTHSLPLLHMAIHIRRDIRILFIETGMHFWETLFFRETLEMKWNLNVVDLRPDERWNNFLQLHWRELPHQDPNLCCYLRKVQPMQKALEGMRAWITGIRRDQTRERAAAQILEILPDGLLKVNPLLNWTEADVEAYRRQYDLPEHPLYAKGYLSIGCAPCTLPVRPGQPVRSGRWAGSGKTECGLHTDMFKDRSLTGIRPTLDLNDLDIPQKGDLA